MGLLKEEIKTRANDRFQSPQQQCGGFWSFNKPYTPCYNKGITLTSER
jgi:hypothetical protein